MRTWISSRRNLCETFYRQVGASSASEWATHTTYWYFRSFAATCPPTNIPDLPLLRPFVSYLARSSPMAICPSAFPGCIQQAEDLGLQTSPTTTLRRIITLPLAWLVFSPRL